MEPEELDVCDVCGGGHAIIHCPELCTTDFRSSGLTSRARMTLPHTLSAEDDADGNVNVIARQALPAKMKLGPYEARRTTQNIEVADNFILKVFSEDSLQMVTLDTTSEAECNWLCLVPTASTAEEQNCIATQMGSEIYYITLRVLEKGDQLKVWYASSYARKLGKPQLPDGRTKVLLGRCLSDLLVLSMPLPPDEPVIPIPDVDHKSDMCRISSLVLDKTSVRLVNSSSAKVNPSYGQSSTTTNVWRNSVSGKKAGSSFNETYSVEKCNLNDDKQVTAKTDEGPVLARRSCRLTSKRFSALELLGIKRERSEKNSENTHSVKNLICGRTVDETKNLVIADKYEETKSCLSTTETFSYDSPANILCSGSVSYLDAVGGWKSGNDSCLVDCSSLSYQQRWKAYDLPELPPLTELEAAKVSNSFERNSSKPNTPEGNKAVTRPTDKISSNSYSFQVAVCKEETLGSLDLCKSNASICDRLKSTEMSFFKTATKKAADPECGNVEIVSGVSRHTCKFCNKTFERQSYLARHIQGHTNVFQCTRCDKKFSRAETLTSHVCPQLFPADGAVHQCKFCGATFRMEKYLVRHLATHSENFKCSACQRSFSRKESLLQHLAKCHPNTVGKGDEMPMYPCDQCSRVFTKELSLQNHMKLHSDSFKCHTCAKAFSSAFSLSRHSCVGDVVAEGLACEMEDGCFECKQCGKILSQRAALRRHLAAHQDSFSCTVCGKKHSRREELAKHELECAANAELKMLGIVKCKVCHLTFTTSQEFSQHHKEHTHPYKCDACGRRFLRQANRDDHQCSAADTGPVDCDICNKSFSSIRYLQRHSAIHAERRHVCERCGRRFNRLDYLHDHICVDDDGHRVRVRRTRHSEDVVQGQNAVVCPICGKNYTSISNLNKHMKTHGEKKEVCDVCGKQFHLKVLLKEHTKYVHSDTYAVECPHCSKRMKSRNSLYGHIALFHPELSQKKAMNHKCSQCGKVFRQKGNLKKHELTHSDKHSYACKQCDKTFKFPEQMRRHDLWHRQGARHRCQMCDRQFVMEFELRKHTETFHRGAAFICKYCQVVCHHQQAMKRHLQRCHFSINEWQMAGPNFIKSLQVFSDTYTNVKQMLMSETNAEQPDVMETFTASSGKLVGVSSHDLAGNASNFSAASGTVILTKTGEGCTESSLLPSCMTYVLQTIPSEAAQFDPDSLIAHSNMVATLNSNQTDSSQSMISLTDLGYAEGLIQLPVSVTEGWAATVHSSEYIFVSVMNST